MPYFTSRLSGSVFQSTFGSYLSTSFTATGFGFLAHATATSKQVWAIFFTLNIPSLCVSPVEIRPTDPSLTRRDHPVTLPPDD